LEGTLSFSPVQAFFRFARVSCCPLLLGMLATGCPSKRDSAPVKKECKANEERNAKTGKCEAKSQTGGGGAESGGQGGGSQTPVEQGASNGGGTQGSGSGSGDGSSETPSGTDNGTGDISNLPTPNPGDVVGGSGLPKPPAGEDKDGDGIVDIGVDANGDGVLDTPPLNSGPGRDVTDQDASTIDRQQDDLRDGRYPPGFAPSDGWDRGGGMLSNGFSSIFAQGNGQTGSARVTVQLWIGRDKGSAHGAVVAFAKFPDPNAASNVKYMYRRKAYPESALDIDNYGYFTGGSLALDVQLKFDFQTQAGKLACMTQVAQLDGRYLAVDLQSAAPRAVLNVDAICGKP
jgi:hypothetical protein